MFAIQDDHNEDFEKGSVTKGKEGKEAPNEDIEADLQVSASAFEALERDFQEVGICWVLMHRAGPDRLVVSLFRCSATSWPMKV